jgi:hypothetical protein
MIRLEEKVIHNIGFPVYLVALCLNGAPHRLYNIRENTYLLTSIMALLCHITEGMSHFHMGPRMTLQFPLLLLLFC